MSGKRKFFCTLFLFLMASYLFSMFAGRAAETSQRSAGEPANRPNERVLRGVLTIYIWKMTDAVKLTDEQSARVFPLVRKAFQTRWQVGAQRRNLLQFFRRAVEKAPQQEPELAQLLEQWGETEEKLHAARDQMRKALTSVLTLEQQAKSILFEESFDEELARVIGETRQQKPEHLFQQNRDTRR